MLGRDWRNYRRTALGRVLGLAVLMTSTGVRATSPAPIGPDRSATVDSVDLRPVFKKWGLDVALQGKRGTCSVFAVTGALEYALASRQRCGTRLSPEFLNWASNEAVGQAVDGGFFSDLWKGYKAHGVCAEKDFPYQAAFDPRRRPSDEAIEHARRWRDIGLRMHWIKPWDVKTGLSELQLLGIKRTLRRQWPVCAGLRWPKHEQWSDGVLKMAPPDGVFDGHSVLLVGFRDDATQPGGGVFFLRNSGRSLHDGSMTYEYARAYMNDAMWIDHETDAGRPVAQRTASGESGSYAADSSKLPFLSRNSKSR